MTSAKFLTLGWSLLRRWYTRGTRERKIHSEKAARAAAREKGAPRVNPKDKEIEVISLEWESIA